VIRNPSFEIFLGNLFTQREFADSGVTNQDAILPKQVWWKDHVRMKLWAWDEKNLPSITHAIRTAVAATLSVALTRTADPWASFFQETRL
jgi:hypothetical protein